MDINQIVREYYTAWAGGNKEKVRSLITDDFRHISPQSRFKSAEDFLSHCWKYSEGLTGVEFVREIYDGDQAFVILNWSMKDGEFAGAEYVKVLDGKIAEILVVNNDPSFSEMIK